MTKNSNNKNNSKVDELNITVLLNSKEFVKNSAAILYKLGITKSNPSYEDYMQNMRMSIIDAVRLYDQNKVNNNFWGFANIHMRAAAHGTKLSDTIVHYPVNRLKKCYGYEIESASYTGLDFEDGKQKPFTEGDDFSLSREHMMDLERCLSTFNDKERFILKAKLALTTTKNNKTDFTSIGNEVGMTMQKCRTTFHKCYGKLSEMMAEYR